MATIFADQASAFDGSSSPSVGSADIDVAYHCVPEDGGRLQLWARPNGSTISYVLLWDESFPRLKKFRAANLQYYYKWTPRVSNAVASLEG